MRTRAGWIAAGLLALIVAAAVYLPIAPQPLEQEPDLSFRATTHDAFARHLQIGRDIVSTYGPWGILARGFDQRTERVVLSVSALLAAVFAWSILRIAHDAGATAPFAAIASLAAGSILAAGSFDARFTAIPLLLILSTLERPSEWRELPLVAALAVMALIKFSLLVLAVFVVILCAVVRRRITPVLGFAVAFLMAWIAAGQHLSSLPLFLKWGAEVSRGYGGASSAGSAVPTAILGAVALMLLVAAMERNVSRTILVAGGIAFLLKVGYMRADVAHAGAANALLLLLATGYLLICGRRATIIGGAVGIAAALVTGVPVLADRIGDDSFALRDWQQRAALFDRELAMKAEAEKVPAVAGTIDAVPWGSAALIVRKMRYTPRPVFQSCMAWTAALAELNAAVLRGPRAPDWLWTSVGSIDARLPMLDDGPSWLEILRRYEIASASGDHLLLRRRPAPKAIIIHHALATTARFGVDIPLPNARVVWCVIEMHPTLLTRLRDSFGRPSGVTMETTTADGVRQTWRVAPAMLPAGFLISPQVTNVEELFRLLSGEGPRVTSVRVNANGFGETYVLRFSEVKTPGRVRDFSSTYPRREVRGSNEE